MMCISWTIDWVTARGSNFCEKPFTMAVKPRVLTRQLLSEVGGRRFVLEWIPGYEGALLLHSLSSTCQNFLNVKNLTPIESS